MYRERPGWTGLWAPIGLALIGLFFLVGVLGSRSAASRSLLPSVPNRNIEPPSAQQERLWAAVGLNDAWFVTNGHLAAPPPSAPSPFWAPPPQESLDTPQVPGRTDFDQPRLVLDPRDVSLSAYADQPKLLSATVGIDNAGGGSLFWSAELAPGGTFTPTLVPTNGMQGESLTLTVDGALYAHGITYTRKITISATPSGTLDSPQVVAASLYVHPHIADRSAYLPQILRQVPSTSTPAPTPVVDEVRAIWVTRYDWTSLYESEGPTDIDEIVANVHGAGFNTIYFQVRAHGDAYYTPGLEPWSARLNDDRVLGQSPGWDPLARMIEQAHARGIQVHAYVNVYPAWLGATAPPESTVPKHVYWVWTQAFSDVNWRQWHSTSGAMALNSGYLWASPGVDAVRDHVVAVVSDLVTRYDLDGVHLDLVRYANNPYSFDPFSNSAAGSVKTDARDQWQRERVSDLVNRIYTAIRTIRPKSRLSAAVWFCYRADGCGYGLSSGYADYYQDSLGWLSAGVIDAIAPMLYEWSGFDNLEIWRDVMLQFQNANAGRHVYPGISGDFDSFAEIADRIRVAREAGAAGHAIFSYTALDSRGYWDDFAAGPYAQTAELPGR